MVSNHDELMSNFFAQPDALACGKTQEDLEKEGVKPELFPHKVWAKVVVVDLLDFHG